MLDNDNIRQFRCFPTQEFQKNTSPSMPKAFHTYKPFFLRVYGAICVNHEGKILLVRGRKSQKWSFPKGHCERNETAEICARRELFEETGLILQTSYTSVHKLFGGEYFVFAVNGEPVVAPIDSIEIEEAKWWPIGSIPSLESNIDLSIFRSVVRGFTLDNMEVDPSNFMDTDVGKRKIAHIKRKINEKLEPRNVPISFLSS